MPWSWPTGKNNNSKRLEPQASSRTEKERDKVYAVLGNEMEHARSCMIALTFTHQTRKAKEKEKEKTKGKVRGKEKRKPKAKEKERRRKEEIGPAKVPGLAQTIGNSDGEKTKEIKAQKEKEKEDDGEKAKVKEKVKARVEATGEVANENNPHSAHPRARIGIRILARLATAASLTTHQIVRTGKTDGANGIKSVDSGISQV